MREGDIIIDPAEEAGWTIESHSGRSIGQLLPAQGRNDVAGLGSGLASVLQLLPKEEQ
jgi:hypothetical protein